jgi:hypothetical protein
VSAGSNDRGVTRKHVEDLVGGGVPDLFVLRKINGRKDEAVVDGLTGREPSGTRGAGRRAGGWREEREGNGSADLASREIDQPDITLSVVTLGPRASRSLGRDACAGDPPQPHLVRSRPGDDSQRWTEVHGCPTKIRPIQPRRVTAVEEE